jgi:two-component system, sensor histidine kinase and response regulator
VAEDNATNRHVIGHLLDRLGYAVEFADDGAEALRTLNQRQGRYGILLTDFHMPIMDGFELTHAIRERENANGGLRLPIVALTADVSPETETRCLEAGMDAYLRKPIERAALVAALEHWLPQALPLKRSGELRRTALAAHPTAAPPLDHAVITSQLGTSDMADHIDVLQSFWDSCGNGPEDLQSAIDMRDVKAAREVAHSLKAATAMIGATELSEALKMVELAARDGHLDRAAAGMGVIRSGFCEIRAYLDRLAPVS